MNDQIKAAVEKSRVFYAVRDIHLENDDPSPWMIEVMSFLGQQHRLALAALTETERNEMWAHLAERLVDGPSA